MKSLHDRLFKPWVVWCLRVLVGATFVFSGFVKAVDPWGFSYKITDYLAVWHIALPHLLTVAMAMAIAAVEFVAGLMTMLGCFRRATTWILALMMGVLLPLTVYIAIANPVEDCGCFGDAWVISNTATMLKNIVLAISVAYLVAYNPHVAGIVRTKAQWAAAASAGLYILALAVYGYTVQPVIDFRPYPEGMEVSTIAEGAPEPDFKYIYRRGDEQRAFSIDELPDEEDGWEFVDREEPEGESAQSATSLAFFDADDNDMTAEVLADSTTTRSLMLVMVPDPVSVDLRCAEFIRGLNSFMIANDGYLVEIVGGNPDVIAYLDDVLVPEWPVYVADDTAIEQVARGEIALVYIHDGSIAWKRTATSLPSDMFTDLPPDTNPNALLSSLAPARTHVLVSLTVTLCIVLCLICFADGIIRWTRQRIRRNIQEKK